ncbi:hypothetical protein LJC05_04770, partial [Bacteroides sp. OttesenSCG-928-J23]|nr:hypothetical protein [Bacteroides sp. OttesenSCG-928-J23]
RNTAATRAYIYEDFTLTADIDLMGADWEPINDYYGTFDGGGHTIKGLKVSSGGNYAGLFGYLGGVVKNLTVEGANVKGGNAGAIGTNNAGYIIACRVINCTVEGSGKAGGIVGHNGGVVVACHTKGGSIQGNSSGGIVGVNYRKIIACVAEPGTVSGCLFPGVLVGDNYFDGLLTACYCRAGKAVGFDYTTNPHTIPQLDADDGITTGECDDMNTAIENYNNNLQWHEAHALCTFRWSSTSIPGSGGGVTIDGFDDEGEIPVGDD